MNTIICVMGKSSAGKDCLARALVKKGKFTLIVPYTTRPMRPGESNGNPYFFLSEEKYGSEDIICDTKFESVHGSWSFGYKRMAKDELDINIPYVAVVSPKQFNMMADEYEGVVNLIGLYIDADEEERMIHAIMRERQKSSPDYAELCRRFVSDGSDFSHGNPDMEKMEKRNVMMVANDFQMSMDDIADEVIHMVSSII